FDGIIGVSSVAMKHFADSPKPHEIIPNGIDLNRFNPSKPKVDKFLDGKINLLFVNRIEERKGLIYLLKAFKILNEKFSNLRLIIVGDGNLRGKCEKYTMDNNLKEIIFEGQVPVTEVPKYYSTCDIFIGSSIFGESFGIVLLEAMATGKPVVAFDNVGYKDTLTGKKGGILVPSKDYEAMAKELEKLIVNESLRKQMGEHGLKEAQDYSWDKIADRVLNFYNICKK
ncbi:MAG: glycosyltransferase family 4 protein, partial [Patescibacteria group bacterium]